MRLHELCLVDYMGSVLLVSLTPLAPSLLKGSLSSERKDPMETFNLGTLSFLPFLALLILFIYLFINLFIIFVSLIWFYPRSLGSIISSFGSSRQCRAWAPSLVTGLKLD